MNGPTGQGNVYLAPDGRTLFFNSNNRPEGKGSFDLYMTTRAQILPATKNDCKNDGWETFSIYKNQGDCVSYVATNGSNDPG